QAVALWNDLVLGFGNSALLMRWGWMRALEHRALGHWLRDLEKLVRRAIRADASELDLPPLKPRAPRPKRSRRQSNEDTQSFRGADADLPATWKACFHMQPPPWGKHRTRKSKEPAERRPCRGYAVRIEALRRVISYRDAYVLRYARRLARLAAANAKAQAETLSRHLQERSRHAAAPEPEPQPESQPALRSAKHVEPG
ncbi:MAG TPA: hypothetical protein VGO52_08110, partial [Hyphomonadaceae bacterium]|nr:hypothetical protein [Hyphomonadaceae bacterium]